MRSQPNFKPTNLDLGISEVDIDQIIVPAGRRLAGADTNFARSINERGLLHPVVLTKDLTLVCGARRLDQFRQLGFQRIPAIIRNFDDKERQKAELEENLTQEPLSYQEEGEQRLRLKELYEGIYPETRRGNTKARAAVKRIGGVLPPSFTKAVASSSKSSARKIQKQLKVVSDLKSDIRDLTRTTKLADSPKQLARLAKHDHETQLKLVGEISRKAANCVRGAELNLTPRKLSADESVRKLKSRLTLMWSEISKAKQYSEFQKAVDRSSPEALDLVQQVNEIHDAMGDWLRYYERTTGRQLDAA